MTDETPLGVKMRLLIPQHPDRAAELDEKALAFERAANGFYGSPQTVDAKQFLGAYARARKLYCEISGEPLV